MSKAKKPDIFYGLGSTMTEEQVTFVEAMLNPDILIVWCNSKAGTGKTQLAVAAAHYLVKSPGSKYDGAVYVFAPIEENKMGYRPGTQREKEDAYITPLKQALVKIGLEPSHEIAWADEDCKYGKWLEVYSHVFQRGINFERRVVIIDEAQNFTASQLKKVLTRIHDTSKVIVIGHTGQCDLEDPNESGFAKYIKHFLWEPYSACVNLTKNFRGRVARHADSL